MVKFVSGMDGLRMADAQRFSGLSLTFDTAV